MNNLSFLHCADLHLGCEPNHLEVRYEDFFISFKQLIEEAINNKCKYILISGDLFHLKVINSKTLLKVISLLQLAKDNEIKVIAIEGNHDKAFYVDEQSWLHFLHKQNYIYLLTHKIEDGKLIIDNDSIYEDDSIRIIGIGYLGSMTSMYLQNIEKKIEKSKKFTVLMLHAAINRLCGEDMGDINIDTLMPLQDKVDYIALGHIHTRYEYNNLCYNPGSIENIRIKDGKKSDKKGYYIVTYNSSKEKNVQFYISKQRKIYNKVIRLEENKTKEEIEYILNNYNYELEENAVMELTIYGNVSFNPYLINFEEIKKNLIDKYKLIYIEISNLINIMANDSIQDNVIDIKAIEEEAIKNYININYPDIDIKDYIDKIHYIKQGLLDEKENDYLIQSMTEKEDILCD